jgi:hypothetical protein
MNKAADQPAAEGHYKRTHMSQQPNYEYTVIFTNKDGKKVEHKFTDKERAAHLCFILSETGTDYELTHHLGASFENWADSLLSGFGTN